MKLIKNIKKHYRTNQSRDFNLAPFLSFIIKYSPSFNLTNESTLDINKTRMNLVPTNHIQLALQLSEIFTKTSKVVTKAGMGIKDTLVGYFKIFVLAFPKLFGVLSDSSYCFLKRFPILFSNMKKKGNSCLV